jgi:hypothetical protein
MPELGIVPVLILLPLLFPILNSETVVPLKLPKIAIYVYLRTCSEVVKPLSMAVTLSP